MSYKNQKILLISAEAAYNKGQLTDDQYLQIIKDIKNELIKTDKKVLKEDVNKILQEYANL